MKKLAGIKTNSVFARLIITFVCILLPLYTIGVNVYSWSFNIVRNEISNTASTQVSFYLNNLEMEIQRMRILQYDCLTDENLSGLAVSYEILDNFDRTGMILALKQRLTAIKNSSRYIKDVRAHIPSINKTISVGNGVSELMESEENLVLDSNPNTEAKMLYDKGRILLPAVYPLKVNKEKNMQPMYTIVIELSEQSLKDALQQFKSYEKGGGALIYGNYILKSDLEQNEEIIRKIHNTKLVELQQGVYSTEIDGKAFSVIYATSKYLGWCLVKFIPQYIVFKPIVGFYMWIKVFFVVAVFIILLYSAMTYKFVHKPLKELVLAFKKVEKGELDIKLTHNYKNEFGYIYVRFNTMVEKLNTLIEQVYKQKILTQRAELKHLQSQINPHFLYNSFFILRSLIHKEEYNGAEEFVQHISTYFQFITRSGADFIPLSKEIDHARVYTDIQKARFLNRIQVTFDELPVRYSGIEVPRLIIQPIIENAFEHGLNNKLVGGKLRILFGEEPNFLLIIIEDNGEEFDDEKLFGLEEMINCKGDNTETTGTVNIHRRIQIKFGAESGLNFSRSELGGLKTVIKLRVEGYDSVQTSNC